MPSESEDDEDLISYSPSTSSDDPNKYSTTTTTLATTTGVPIAAVPINTNAPTEPPPLPTPPQQPQPPAISKPSLFQRLWTDSDEIGLLQGFLDYTTQRVGSASSSYHLDTNLFYDQIKSRLQLDFNKSQLVEKLRRLKKKYRNALNRMSNGRDLSFKSPHEQAAFEISHKIWSGNLDRDRDVVEIEESKTAVKFEENSNGNDKKISPKPKKRTRIETDEISPNLSNLENLENSNLANVIEDTVKSCLSPLVKELFNNVINVESNSGWLGGSVPNLLPSGLNSVPLGFGAIGPIGARLSGEEMDEKWRKQRILELEVYAKRIELVQDEIRSKLEELKGSGS